MNSKLTREERDIRDADIERRYRAGESSASLAIAYEISTSRITDILAKRAVPMKKGPRGPRVRR